MPLREVRSEDIPVFYAYQSDRRGQRAGRACPPRDREAYEEHWAACGPIPRSCCARSSTDDGAVAGQLLSFPREGIREIGYWLGRGVLGPRAWPTASLAEFLSLVERASRLRRGERGERGEPARPRAQRVRARRAPAGEPLVRAVPR